MVRIFLLICVCLIHQLVLAQNVTTEGTDFWFGFMENHETSRIDLEVFISATDSTGGELKVPGTSFIRNFSVKKDSTVQITIPSDVAMATGSEFAQQKGVHVSSELPVSVFALNKRSRSADATVVLPTVSLGKEYYATAHAEPADGGPSLASEILIVAVTDDTEIEITPSATTLNGKAALDTFKIVLDQGEVYQIKSWGDLSGTYLTAANTEKGDCKNFAVFGGNEWTRIGGCGGAQDHLYNQMFPVHAWGQQFYTIPYKTRGSGDLFKIVASEDSTEIKIGGANPIYLNRGKFYTRRLYIPTIISANKPISLAQFSLSQSCDNVEADPFMIMVSPVEQLLKKVTFDAFSIHVVDNYYVNILRKTSTNAPFYIDDIEIGSQFLPFPGDDEYAFVSLDIDEGIHTLACEDGFSAVVYGYGDIESFGYATGVSINNLNLEILSKWADDSTFPDDRACIGTNLQFQAASDNEFVKFEWDFGDGTITDAPATMHEFDQTGIYPVRLKAFTDIGTCASLEEAVKLIHVVKPEIRIIGPSSVCPNTPEVGYQVLGENGNLYQWWGEGGLIERTVADSVYINWGTTNEKALIKTLPVNNIGCIGDTAAYQVRINVKLEPDLPIGIDSLCSIDGIGQEYQSFFTQGSEYQWETSNGMVVEGQNNYKVRIDWNEPGQGLLWYRQTSSLDEVCDGISDTLMVFIERAPDPEIIVEADQFEFFSGETVNLNLEADQSFTHFSWDLDDGLSADSLPGVTSRSHLYACEGIYEVEVQGFTSNICRVAGTGNVTIKVNPPEIKLLSVSETRGQQSDKLRIRYDYRGSRNYNYPLELARSQVFPETSEWTVIAFPDPQMAFIDDPINTSEEIYQYQISTNHGCPQLIESSIQQNILLTVTNDEASLTTLAHTGYSGWAQGVNIYETWRSKDDSAYLLMTSSLQEEQLIEYQMDGFEFCYQIKAVSSDEVIAWSNISCDSFVPELETYNIFTPNFDASNPTFKIDRIELYPKSFLQVFNRHGRPVYESLGYQNDWDGSKNGDKLPAGVYFYVLKLNEERSPVKELKGWVQILY